MPTTIRSMNDVALGRALRAIRIQQRLRQTDVAVKAGVAQQLVSRIERGDSGRMSRHSVSPATGSARRPDRSRDCSSSQIAPRTGPALHGWRRPWAQPIRRAAQPSGVGSPILLRPSRWTGSSCSANPTERDVARVG
jgi:DNA-binding XRE family transcriptional regulator